MSRRRIKQIIAIVILVALLALLGLAFLNFSKTGDVGIDVNINSAELLPIPKYLYSFSGQDQNRLTRPLGVLAASGKVFVTDSRKGTLEVFTPRGRHLATWGKGNLIIPLYVAENPKTKEIWVSDRRLRQLAVFSAEGKFLRYFDPKLPPDQLPTFKTGGVQWAPLALAFAPDGTLYVTEILNGHRLLIFSPDGTFKKSIGTAGLVNDANQGQAVFQFPNSVKVIGKEVWVADSNNRRLQVFDLEGNFKKFLITQGLPRGFDALPKLNSKEPLRLVVVDTLSHQATLWDAPKGSTVFTFGERGVLEGQFSYPNDVSIDKKRLIFIADTDNGRIQVWGWPAVANPIPTPTTPMGWLLCLSPLLLLPLLLLFRKRRFFATADFVYAMVEAGEVPRMKQPRTRWEVTEADYEQLRTIVVGDIEMETFLHPVDYSPTDAQALRDRYELDERASIIMSIAQRAKLFCTEDTDLRRVARVMEIPVVNHVEFIEQFDRKDRSPGAGPGEGYAPTPAAPAGSADQSGGYPAAGTDVPTEWPQDPGSNGEE